MTWIVSNWNQIAQYALAHLALSIPPIILGLALSLPLGWLASRFTVPRGVLLVLGGILYAIPSLPLFVVLPSIIGTRVLDPLNVEVALTLYAVALLVRATSDALQSVDRDVMLSASAVGYSPWQRFWAVQLPLSAPVLIAGLRVVSVSTVSLVTVGSVIGVNSLGFFFLDGYQRSFPLEIVVGIVGTVLIALVLDAVLVVIGRALTPWARHRRVRGTASVAAALGAS